MEALFFDEGNHLRSLVEASFLEPHDGLTKAERAIWILDVIFSRLVPGMDFAAYIAPISNKKERDVFISCLLYHIFSLTLPLEHLRSKEELEAYLFRILSSVCSQKGIMYVWNSFSYTTQIKTAAFALTFYDEGSFALLKQAKKIACINEICTKVQAGLLPPAQFWHWAKTQHTISESDIRQFLYTQQEKQQAHTLRFHTLACEHFARPFTLEQVTNFIAVFGLFGHQIPPNAPFLQDYEGLDDKLEAICDCLKTADPEGEAYTGSLDFSNRIKAHLDALTDHPEYYVQGLKNIVYAMPTCGRDLEAQGCLESLLEGMKRITRYLKVPGSDYAVFVFDQSNEKQLKKNRRAIARLQKRYLCRIIHCDARFLINLAKEHGLYELIVTGPMERFGYTGARNAIFLLGPLLHARFYNKPVSYADTCIMMCDDDLIIPPQNMFSDALFAYEQQDAYFCRVGFIVGRTTTEVYGALEPTTSLSQANKILSQSQWSNKQVLHLMATLVSKPKICINLPFGQEENHLIAMKNYYFDLRHPALHLAGWRYPHVKIPVNRYSGLAEHLKKLNSYVLGLGLVTDMLDPPDVLNRSCIVWNSVKEPFSGLQEAISCITAPATVQAMQKKFWENFHNYFKPLAGDEQPQPHSSAVFKVLLDKDIKKVISEMLELHPYLTNFKKELQELTTFFESMTQEALWMKEFSLFVDREIQKGKDPGKTLEKARVHIEQVSQKSITCHYFTNHIYEICRIIGLAGFQKALSGRVYNAIC